jgi:DNA modification methylase
MLVPITSIKANKTNPRIIKDDKFKKLVKSIHEFPDMLNKRQLVCYTDTDGKYVVIGGNMRLKAAQELGLKELPILLADDWTQEQRDEFLIKDNVGFGEWDWDQLANEWDAGKLDEWGLDVPSFDTEVLEAEEDDFDTTPPEIPITVLGDLYEIGEHRLLCGDSTDSDQVGKLMNGQKADMAHNDPPYGMKKEKDGVLNDNLNYSDLLDFNREWIDTQFLYLKDNGSWYCWGIDEPLMDIYSEILKPYIAEQKATFRNLITWDKGHGQGQNSDNTRSYAIADEKCLFAMMGVQGFNNNADNYFKGWDSIVNYLDEQKNIAKFTIKDCKRLAGHSEKSGCHWFDKSQWMMPTKETYDSWRNNCIENNIDAFKKEYEELKKEYYSTRAYFNNIHDNFNNVWKFDRHLRQGDEGGHATPKPIPLCERAIKSSCPDDGLVLDVFLGSGSTMVASHQLKRKCYGMELDPKYCDVIVNRMIALEPNIEIKLNGKPFEKAH